MTLDHSSQSQKPESKQFRGKLARNFLFIVLILTIIPTSVMGLVSHLRTRTLLIDQITEQLDEIITQETLESFLNKYKHLQVKINNYVKSIGKATIM